jgi:general secretion pathway protein A
MYLDFYKLHLKPFQISTDPRFLWLGEKHQEALAVLKYGILDNKGFLLLTGDVGTGKTTLLNALIDSLGENVLVAMVADPGLAKMDFFNFVADSFGMNRSFQSKGEFLIFLKNYLINLNRQNKQALLIIDECQHLNQKLLEEVRLLSNIEMASTKLINIFFVGQSEFNNIILRPHNRAIRQRITINYNISALSEKETEQYIRFRLSVAGSDDTIFTSDAIKTVYQFSNGYPRLINIVCDQALLTGYVKEKPHIDAKIVAECAQELKIPHWTSTEDSAATPEARTEKTDEASRLKNARPAWWPNRPMKKMVVMALVTVMIIWAGLVTLLTFNRPRSDATHNASDQKTAADHTPAAVVAGEMPGDARGRSTKVSEGPSRPAEEEAVPAAAPGSPGNAQSKSLPMVNELAAAKTRISLGDILETYGTYPEVYFGFNSNQLDDSAYELLGMVARFCLQNPEAILVLRGYTDRSGVRAYNLKLSEFRADMVKAFLVGRGVREGAITTIAVGPDEQGPAGTTVSYEGERRKVLIEIISPTG